MIRSTLIVGGLLCALMSPRAFAAEITFDFAGEISGYLQASNSTMAAVPLGATISGSYSFESTTPDDNLANPNVGLYEGALTALSFSVGGGDLVSLDPNAANKFILAADGDPTSAEDGYFVTADVIGMVAPGIDSDQFSILLLSSNAAAITSEALPVTPPDLANFTSVSDSLFFVLNQTEVVNFTLTSLTTIPEPATFALLGLGFACCTAVRRRS